MNRLLISLLALSAALSSQAHSGVLFSDDFSDSGSGTGFATSSTWSNAAASGGAIVVTEQNDVYRKLASTIPIASADFWFVVNLTYTGTTIPEDGYFGISFYDGTNESLFFGSDTESTTWEFDTSKSDDQTSSIPNYTGQPTRLVAHITGNRIDLWINPDDVSNPSNLGPADASYTNAEGVTTESQWTRLRIAAKNGSASKNRSSSVTVYNLTAATTLAEAIAGSGPPPEPASYAMCVANHPTTVTLSSAHLKSGPTRVVSAFLFRACRLRRVDSRH
jgi:hypothetical protein